MLFSQTCMGLCNLVMKVLCRIDYRSAVFGSVGGVA